MRWLAVVVAVIFDFKLGSHITQSRRSYACDSTQTVSQTHRRQAPSSSQTSAWFTYNAIMPATCLRDGRRCLLEHMSQTQRRYVADSEALSASNRRSWIGFNSPDRSPSPLRRNACLRLVCDVYFLCEQLSARWRRQNKCDFSEVCDRSGMNLKLVYDASVTPSGCCRRHEPSFMWTAVGEMAQKK